MPAVFTPETVTFSCEGFALRGTLRRPGGAAGARTGVVLLNQGPLDRSGAHQISTKIAKRLNATFQLPTLQFDARGVGESDGDWAISAGGEPIQQVYGRIFNGAWKPDTLAAISYFQQAAAIDKVVLVGLCGGASTALHVAALHPAVSGVAMVGMPVRHDANAPGLSGLADGFIRDESSKYFQKLLSLNAWKRLLTLQTDFATFRDVMIARLTGGAVPGSEKAISSCISESFGAAVAARRRLLFVYGENDYYWTEFRELFLPAYPDRGAFELVTIPAANHTLTDVNWQEQLFASLCSWLGQHHAAQPRIT